MLNNVTILEENERYAVKAMRHDSGWIEVYEDWNDQFHDLCYSYQGDVPLDILSLVANELAGDPKSREENCLIIHEEDKLHFAFIRPVGENYMTEIESVEYASTGNMYTFGDLKGQFRSIYKDQLYEIYQLVRKT